MSKANGAQSPHARPAAGRAAFNLVPLAVLPIVCAATSFVPAAGLAFPAAGFLTVISTSRATAAWPRWHGSTPVRSRAAPAMTVSAATVGDPPRLIRQQPERAGARARSQTAGKSCLATQGRHSSPNTQGVRHAGHSPALFSDQAQGSADRARGRRLAELPDRILAYRRGLRAGHGLLSGPCPHLPSLREPRPLRAVHRHARVRGLRRGRRAQPVSRRARLGLARSQANAAHDLRGAGHGRGRVPGVARTAGPVHRTVPDGAGHRHHLADRDRSHARAEYRAPPGLRPQPLRRRVLDRQRRRARRRPADHRHPGTVRARATARPLRCVRRSPDAQRARRRTHARDRRHRAGTAALPAPAHLGRLWPSRPPTSPPPPAP